MLFIDTSAVIARTTPLITASSKFPFLEAFPRRILQPDQQVSYRRYALQLFSEQQANVKQGKPASVVLEEDVLSLVSLEREEVLEVHSEHAVIQAKVAPSVRGNVRQPLASKAPASGKENQDPKPPRKPTKPVKVTSKSQVIDPASSEPLVPHLDLSALNFQQRLGSGGQGSVFLAYVRGSTRPLAVKIVKKDGKSSTERNVTIEKEILKLNRGDRFLTSLEGAFHDSDAFYLPYYPGGDLQYFLWRQPGQKLSLEMARFFSAELIFGVAALHGANILHRDLKLANLFIKADGHLCIGDFGMAVTFEEDIKPVAKGSFAGTSTHLAPETWKGQGYTPATDWWAVGVNIYQMFHGDTPWSGSGSPRNYQAMAMDICENEPIYSRDLDFAARLLLEGCLHKDHKFRFGFTEASEHPFFASISWVSVSNGRLIPLYVPKIREESCTVSLQDLPKVGEPYHEDPLPKFGYTSPELEELLVKIPVSFDSVQLDYQTSGSLSSSPTETFNLSFIGRRKKHDSSLSVTPGHVSPRTRTVVAHPVTLAPDCFQSGTLQEQPQGIVKSNEHVKYLLSGQSAGQQLPDRVRFQEQVRYGWLWIQIRVKKVLCKR